MIQTRMTSFIFTIYYFFALLIESFLPVSLTYGAEIFPGFPLVEIEYAVDVVVHGLVP